VYSDFIFLFIIYTLLFVIRSVNIVVHVNVNNSSFLFVKLVVRL